MPRQFQKFLCTPLITLGWTQGSGGGPRGHGHPVRACKNLAPDTCGIKIRLGKVNFDFLSLDFSGVLFPRIELFLKKSQISSIA